MCRRTWWCRDILERGDVEDVIAALSPRPVLLAGLVDGRNRRLNPAELDEQLAVARAAYHGPTSKMEVREQTDETELAHWLARQALP